MILFGLGFLVGTSLALVILEHFYYEDEDE